MTETLKKTFVIQPLLRSLIPFLIGTSCYFFREFFRKDLSPEQNSQALLLNSPEDSLRSQMFTTNTQGDILNVDLLGKLGDMIFGIYTNYFAFLLMVLLIDLIFGIFRQGKQEIRDLVKSIKSTNVIFWNSQSRNLKNESVQNFTKKLFMRIICYSLIFMIYQMVGFCIFSSAGFSHVNDSQVFEVTQTHQERESFMNIPRILEENDSLNQEKTALVLQESQKTSEKISLTMGEIISSLNIEASAMVLSRDRKTAFVTLDFYGTLKIIDLSDVKSPVILSSLGLDGSGYYYKFKSGILSSDEKTLYLSNSKVLEIVDVTNLESPKLISTTKSEIFLESLDFSIAGFWQTSLVLDGSTKTLFIGGLGLQVYDVSNSKEPILLNAYTNDMEQVPQIVWQVFRRNEIRLSHDGKALLVVNGSLDVYDISSPKDLKLINSFSMGSDVRSIYLSEDSKVAYLLGTSGDKEMILEEVDISDYHSPKSLQSYTINEGSIMSPRILAVSPGRTKFYISTDEYFLGIGMIVFDAVKKTATKNGKSFLSHTYMMVFSEDGRTLLTASNEQFLVVDMFLDYPNTQIFASSPHILSNIFLPYECSDFKVSPDEKLLFLMLMRFENEGDDSLSYFEIWDLSNVNTPTVLSSYNYGEGYFQMEFTHDYNTVYLAGQNITILDISNKSSPILIKQYENEDLKFTKLALLSNERTGFLLEAKQDLANIYFFDNSELLPVPMNRSCRTFNCKMILKNDQTLLVLDKEITIYDVSNPRIPVEIASLPISISEPEIYVDFYQISADQKTLYVEIRNLNEFKKLIIYDVSISRSPSFVSETPLPKSNRLQKKTDLFYMTSDLKSGLSLQKNSLINMNLTDLKQPKISGIIPLSENQDDVILMYQLSPDGQRIYTVSGKNEFQILNKNIKYTLYLRQEKFSLGEKYSGNVAMLKLMDGASEYDMIDTDSYEIIKLSLVDMKVVPNQDSLGAKTSLLPSWITFDEENNLLNVEPKKLNDLGSYTFQAALSLKIPESLFNNLFAEADKNSLYPEDLLAWLISLDYMNPDFFLTAHFRSFEKFLLPSQFKEYKLQIYNILKQFHVVTYTGFEIIPSLELERKNTEAIEVSTLSVNHVKVEIAIDETAGGSTKAQFLNKPYGSLLPVINQQKSKITLEGSLKDINSALESIVVDLGDKKSLNRNATVIINDGLNPIFTRNLTNILRYFKSNKRPILNKSLQEQFDKANIFHTGEYFTMSLKEDTFTDEYSMNRLSYELEMPTSDSALPNWLSLNGLTLKGTPPEEFLGREIHLVLVAKNEFKAHKEPFTIHVKLSASFLLKLLLRYSPYILTAIGLWVSFNKIFNVFGTKWYKHPKEFLVNVGEEIVPEVIFPVAFIREEQKQSQLIFKYIKERFRDFIDDDGGTGVLNKNKVIDAIHETIKNMSVEERANITLYPSLLIDEIIVNKFVHLQLELKRETKTKLLFEDLKTQCLEVVEKDQAGFRVNQNKLNKLVQKVKGTSFKEGGKDLEEDLINDNGINIELLKDAILAYAFKNNTVEASPVDVDIEIKQKVQRGSFLKLLKFDLMAISFNDKNKIDYGINYKILDDKLYFYGRIRNSFKNKTIVVQIKNRKHKIKKEIWIHGRLNGDTQKFNEVLVGNEHEARGQGYEIF